MESPRLRILLLGPPVITWDNLPVKLSRRLLRMFLLYLASQVKPVPRDEVCQLFWPKLDDSHAHKNLRELLSKLRSELPDSTLVLTDNNAIFLDPQKVYIDALEYNSLAIPLVSSTEMQRNSSLPDWMYLQMRKALDLFRGNQFLQGLKIPESLELTEWLTNINRTIEYSYLMFCERLGSHCISIGNLDEALVWLGKVSEIDPVDTENNFLIINCLQDRGRIKEALDFISFIEQLYRSGNDEPLPKTISDIRARLFEKQFDDREVEIIEWPGGEKSPYPFIGRADLLQQLYHANHRKGIVSIKGESGVGKSRLVEEFYSRMSVKPRLLFCSGKPMIKCSPFQPLIEGLRASVKADEWLQMPEANRQVLSNAFPELRMNGSVGNADPSNPKIEDEITSFFYSFHSILEIISNKKPLLMVIDIVPWCDDTTLEFLSYLSDREFFQKHGLLIILGRKEEVNPLVEIYIDRNTMLNTLEKIEVPPFTREETRQMVQGIQGKNCDPLFLDRLYTNSGGNPYFIIEGIKVIDYIRFDASDFQPDSFFPIPPTVRALVSEKLRLLSDRARQVLQSASILGQSFQPRVVEVMEKLPPEQLVSFFEELQKFSILTISEGLSPESWYQFPHDQVREVVLSDLSPLRKRLLHLKAVNALLEVNGDRPDLASIFAYHYEQANEWSKAYDAWIKAGQYARSVFSRSDTYKAYQKAADLIPLLPNNLPGSILQMVTEWGDYAYDLSDIETCRKIYDLCYEIGEQNSDPLLLGVGLSGKGRVKGMELQIDEGISLVQQGIKFLSLLENKGEVLEANARLGTMLLLKNDFIQARRIFEQALETQKFASTQRERDALINIQTQLGLTYVLGGDPDKALLLIEQTRYLSQLIRRRSAKIQSEAIFAVALYFNGDYKKSMDHATAVYNLAEKLKMRWWQSFLDGIIARDQMSMGDMDEAWLTIQRLLDRKKGRPFSPLDKESFAILGDFYRFYGDFKTANEVYKQGYTENPSDYHELEITYLMALTGYQLGNTASGKLLLDRAIKVSREKGLGIVTARASMTEFLVNPSALLDVEKQSQLDEIIADFHNRGMDVSEATARLVNGMGQALKGATERAQSEFEFVVNFSKSHFSAWMELSAVQRLRTLYPADSKENLAYKKEINRILTRIGNHSTIPAVHKLFLKYQKKIAKT